MFLCNCFLFENTHTRRLRTGLLGKMVGFNLEKSRGMFRLEHFLFEYLLLSIENLAVKDIAMSLLLLPQPPLPTTQFYLLVKHRHICISIEQL